MNKPVATTTLRACICAAQGLKQLVNNRIVGPVNDGQRKIPEQDDVETEGKRNRPEGGKCDDVCDQGQSELAV